MGKRVHIVSGKMIAATPGLGCCRCGIDLENQPAAVLGLYGELGQRSEEAFDPYGSTTSSVLVWCGDCYNKVLAPVIKMETRKRRTLNG